ncbi:MAG: hypothetical protein IK062_04350 [Selenomonadaceae bacterium]|nr:hypothetical protein [Selenomonadaceae bacterium]
MKIADLKVEGIKYTALKDIGIVEKIHDHGVCILKLLVDEKFSEKEILNWKKQKITVKADKNIIFCGIITNCIFENNITEKFLTLTVKSLSVMMDFEKKTFTMQSPKKKISDVLKKIEKDFKPAEINVVQDKTVADLIYCDNLTAWEFLKNFAESHGQILFVDSKTDKLKINFGFKEFKEIPEKNLTFLSQSISMDFYKKLEANTYSGARSCYFFDTNLSTENILLGVGYGLKYENQVQAVIANRIFLRDDTLFNEIQIRHKEGCLADSASVIKTFDRFFYLTGKVLESKDNNLKIQFDCDEKQEKNDAAEIPFESSMSNYFYTMPDENEKVFVYVDNILKSAMGSIRLKGVSDAAEKKSLKTKNITMNFDKEKISFETCKQKISEGEKVEISAKDINFSAKGDIYIQSSAGMLPDNQLIMAAPHFTGYGMYVGMMGQPATVQFNPAGSTVGKVPAQIKNSSAKKESIELSDIAKELNKITNTKEKKSENKNSGGGSGGSIKFDGKKIFFAGVKDSSIEAKGSNLNVKTRALIQVGYIPSAGGGTGSGGAKGGNPKNRSEKINVEHGSEDRKRIKEKISPTPDNKNISR